MLCGVTDAQEKSAVYYFYKCSLLNAFALTSPNVHVYNVYRYVLVNIDVVF